MLNQREQSDQGHFKGLECDLRQTLPSDTLVGLRLDGKAFHTLTKQFERPFDPTFMGAMDATAKALLEGPLANALGAHVQSDEISIFFRNGNPIRGNQVLGGKVEKILSIAASTATLGFLRALPGVQGDPVFDARLFVLGDSDNAQRYLDWRRMDARKNAITMAASCLRSHRELMGMSTRDRLGVLQGTHLEALPEGFLYGRLMVRVQREIPVTTPWPGAPATVLRNFWEPVDATRDVAADFIHNFDGGNPGNGDH